MSSSVLTIKHNLSSDAGKIQDRMDRVKNGILMMRGRAVATLEFFHAAQQKGALTDEKEV